MKHHGVGIAVAERWRRFQISLCDKIGTYFGTQCNCSAPHSCQRQWSVFVFFFNIIVDFLCFLDGGGSSPGTMTLSCVPGCELLPLCAASRFSAFDSACIALTHSKRSEIAFAVDCSPLSLFWRLTMLHKQPRCHSQENSQ